MKSTVLTGKILRLAVLLLVMLLPFGAQAAWIENASGWNGNWGGVGTTVTYSFATTNYAIVNAYSSSGVAQVVPGSWRTVIAAAFDVWASNSGLNFVEVADSGQALGTADATGDIRVALTEVDPAGVLAYAYLPTGGNTSYWGDLHFDSEWDWYVGTTGSPGAGQVDLLSVAIHEIGHSIGIVHNDDPTSVMYPTYTIGTTKRELGTPETDLVQEQYGEAATPEPGTMILLLVSLGAGYFMSSSSDD